MILFKIQAVQTIRRKRSSHQFSSENRRNIPRDAESIPQEGPTPQEENSEDTIFKLRFAEGRRASQ